MPPGARRVARVLVDSPLPQLDRLLDYEVPDALTGIEPGMRVTVPLRTAGRVLDALVVEIGTGEEFPGPLSAVQSLVSTVPVLRPEVWTLARTVANRAAGSANDVLRLAIPKRQVRVETAWLARTAAELEPLPVAAPIPGYPTEAVERIATERGRAALTVAPGVDRTADGRWVGRWAITLAAAAHHALQSGGSAILVVPDYRDVDQLHAAVAAVVPADRIVRWEARQSNPDRYRGLLRAIDDEPAVIIGTRSAVYAPAGRLAMIAVWDDGDPLHQEPLAPHVHARDAALVRAEQQSAALLLAGQTRTTDVQRLVELGYLDELLPTRRSRPKVLPTAQLTSSDRAGEQGRIPSAAWSVARDALAHGPVLVQVARPGFAPGLACADCGEAARCPRCTGPFRQSRAGAIPTCRWCGTPATVWTCPNCEGRRMRPRGSGSTRTAEELGRAFPNTRVIVADGDHQLTEIDDRPALVIATRGAEPLAAGGYRAVLLLDGDRMVARETLRIGEDCLRWWSNAAALAADGATTVLVGVGGALATALTGWRQDRYAAAELADRRQLRFPPAVRAATLTGDADSVAGALELVVAAGGEAIGPVSTPDGVRAIVRVDYAHGGAVADALRGEVVRLSASRRRTPAAPKRGRRQVPLRVRMDDPEPFAE